jgi:hypothetical protein
MPLEANSSAVEIHEVLAPKTVRKNAYFAVTIVASFYECALSDKGNRGKGNVLSKLLGTRIPYFEGCSERNSKIISEVVKGVLKAKGKAGRLEQQITEAETELNRRVYSYFDLSSEEIQFIEDSFGVASISVNLLR